MKKILALLTTILLTGCSTMSTMKMTPALPASMKTKAKNETEVQTNLRIDFLDVGQADAALIECDGEYMMIDGGNRDDSALIYTVLKERNIEELKYIVATHAHEDHVGGLTATYHATTVKEALIPYETSDNEFYNELMDEIVEFSIKKTVVHPGEMYTLGRASFTVLAPYNLNVEDTNNTSIVIKLDHIERSFLFTGDAEWDEEQDILEHTPSLDCDVIKVGHHGSESSTSYRFLREVMPEIAIISVGRENDYGHPTEEVLSRLKDAGAEVHRTDLEGTITLCSDGKNITLTMQKKTQAALKETEKPVMQSEDAKYILNTHSKKVHKPQCEAVQKMSEKNRQEYTGDIMDIIAQGYNTCGMCIRN